jgi:RNA polymerase sigma factor (TIGR02999 family)
MEMSYDQLRQLARRQLRRVHRDQTLDTTALVHETYIKLASAEVDVESGDHFLSMVARAMRQVVVDLLRKRYSEKRGGGELPLVLDGRELAGPERPACLLDLDAALDEMAQHDLGLVRVVDCRFFAGMTEQETAHALGMSLRTVQRSWQTARRWLRAQLRGTPPEALPPRAQVPKPRSRASTIAWARDQTPSLSKTLET